jgi:hypothetical protein
MRSKVRSASDNASIDEPSSGRPLVATERALFTFSRLSPINLVVLVRLEGPELGELLPQALAALQVRHPLLRARITGTASRPCFEISDDAAAPAGVGAIPLKLGNADDDLDPAADALTVVEDEMNAPFDTGRGPLARVTSISGGTGSDLVLTLHHAIADGTSTATLMHELLDWCGARVGRDASAVPAQQAPLPLPLPPPLTEVLPHSTRGAGRQQQELRFALSQGREEIAYRRDTRGQRHPIPAQGRVVTRALALDADGTASLINSARRRRLTMTSVLSAAVLQQASVNLYGGHPTTMRAIVWVDLRPYLNPPVSNETLGCYASMLRFVIRVDPNGGFAALAATVQEHIERAARRGDRIPAALMSAPMAGIMHRLPLGRLGTTAISYAAVPPVNDNYGPITVRDLRAFVSNTPTGAELAASSGVTSGALWCNLLYLDSELTPDTAAAAGTGLLATLQGFADAEAT